MRAFVEKKGIMKSTPRRALISSYHATKILVTTPLLRWYLMNGLIMSRVYTVVEYTPKRCFKNFGESVTKARQVGALDESKVVIANQAKLMGNSSYGKTITNTAAFVRVNYTDEDGAQRAINSNYFRRLDEVDRDIYEVHTSYRAVRFNLPFHIGFFVLNYAKEKMLSFYYQFLNKYIPDSAYQMIQMDTDSMYMAIAAQSLHQLVPSNKAEAFYDDLKNWLPPESCEEHRELYKETRVRGEEEWHQLSCCQRYHKLEKFRPGLFKMEWEGRGMVALCSKTYLGFGETTKLTCKGIVKRQNNLSLTDFQRVLNNKSTVMGENRGFRAHKGRVYTYLQKKDALTFFYPKRHVMEDGVSTEPLHL